MNRREVALALAAGAVAGGAAAAEPTVARTRAGAVRGASSGGILAFKGVPYGVADRFEAPRPPTPWSGVREALDYGASSPQPRPDRAASEDCLVLNVWTPALRDRGRRPVLVYIHGGAYTTGSGSHPTYDGARLARRGDVVVVTLNHRLNAFGYAYLARLDPRLPDSGAAGQLDLVLALQWVRETIAEFGGDPGCVTVFGQSGGGAKIATLMAMPAARGLFHRAWTMSGQQLTASGPLHAGQRAAAWMEVLKVADTAALRRLPAERLVEALATPDPIIGAGGLYFGPVLDARNLARHPFYPDAPPQSAAIPMVVGNTHDETRLFLGRNDPSAYKIGWDDLPARLAREMRVDILPETVVAAYRRMHPEWSPSDVLFGATTASRSWRAAIVEAELRSAQGAPTWAYQLDWRSPVRGGELGAFHTLDIPLVFDTVEAGRADTGGGADAQGLAEQMSAALLRFARTGSPEAPGRAWPMYRLPRRTTRVFDTHSRNVDDPRGDERQLFAAVPFVQQGT